MRFAKLTDIFYVIRISSSDHPGIPNAQLIVENASIAAMYKNQSVAEQVCAGRAVEMTFS